MTIRPPALSAPAANPALAGTRVEGLLDAHRLITADLSLAPMLDRIAVAARDLLGAEAAALVVLGPDARIARVVQQGLDASRSADVAGGRSPRGMRSSLRVAVVVRGSTFGELHVFDRRPGRFDRDEETLLAALAATAGTAIENARIFEQARRGRDWLDAAGAIARALLVDADEDALLDVVSQALDIAEADYAALILPTDPNKLRVTVAKGPGTEEFLGHVFDVDGSPLGRAIIAGESLHVDDLLAWTNPTFVNRHGWGPAMLAPLADARGTRGAILLIRHLSRSPFSAEDVQQASTFATQVALALELNDARADAEWLRVIEDRHRIAEDLHDNVMQRLFATGMGLQVVANGPGLGAEVADRLGRSIADLDETIDQIRVRVFDLRSADPPPLRYQRGRYPHVGSGRSAAESGASEV